MDEKYFPQEIEKKWQQRWEENRAFQADDQDGSREKFYCLEMLPYPSGFLHMGHVLKRLGISYDWSREIAAHRPDYYKWDQWFFLKMLERGLAYKKNSPVNWCPKEQTVLSNEQSSGGICWRCGTVVEKRDLEQWFLRITEYAEQLVADIEQIEAAWPEKVLKRQRDWVGRSEGAYIDFDVKDSKEKIRVFTTRIDTIFGATAVVLSAEHPLLAKLLEGSSLKNDVAAFAAKVKKQRATSANAPEEEKATTC